MTDDRVLDRPAEDSTTGSLGRLTFLRSIIPPKMITITGLWFSKP